MDETRARAIVREEIALAVKVVGEIADLRNSRDSDDPGTDALYEISGTASDFQQYAYAGSCEEADQQRAADAENPFEEPKPTDPAVQAVVHAEVQNVLMEMRDALYGSGVASDYSVAERLDYLIKARGRAAGE